MGTLFPCSPGVARAMVRDLETSGWRAAVELGPGDGVLTQALLEALPRRCSFTAVELSPVLSAQFRQKLPHVDLAQRDAADLVEVCLEREIGALDAVFSALPLKLLSHRDLQGVLDAASTMLRPGGVFAQVTYWPTAFHHGRLLREEVASAIGPIQSDRLVAGNAPPAWVFRCIKPDRSGTV